MQLKIEGDVARSQVSQLKRETDDLKVKLADADIEVSKLSKDNKGKKCLNVS